MLVESLFAIILANFFPRVFVTPPSTLLSFDVSKRREIWLGMNVTSTGKRPQKKIVDTRESLGMVVSAASALVVDVNTGSILFEKNSRAQHPLASITKLMTALVFLDHNPGWEQVVTVQQQYRTEGSNMDIEVGLTMTARDLFMNMLIASHNDAARALVDATGLSQYKFVQRMNERALALGMVNTSFIEPTGLNPENISTAEDAARLLREVLETSDIHDVLIQRTAFFKTREREGEVILSSTSRDFFDSYLNNKKDYYWLGGKTGYIEESGYNLAAGVENGVGDKIIGVIFGAKSRESRFVDFKSIITWTFENFIFDGGT